MAVAFEPHEIEPLFQGTTSESAFASLEARVEAVAEAERLQLRGLILDALEASVRSGPPRSRDWLEALFAASPAYLRAVQGASAESLTSRLQALVIAVLTPLPPTERAEFLGGILPNLSDLSLACALLRPGADPVATEAFFGPAEADLQSDLRARVEILAASEALWLQASPAAILWFWWAAAQEDRVYAFVRAGMRGGSSLSALLDLVVEPRPPEAGGDLIAVRRWSKIIDFQSLEKAALQLALTGGSREDRRRARRFLDAFGNGKSELFR